MSLSSNKFEVMYVKDDHDCFIWDRKWTRLTIFMEGNTLQKTWQTKTRD